MNNLGLTDHQYDYARRLIAVVKARPLPIKAAYITMATAITESGLQMYANYANPDSLNYPHDAIGSDYDSIGLFQQRPNWGSTAQRMNCEESCRLFLDRLEATAWVVNDEWVAAQDVQNSAFDGNPRVANHFNATYGGNYYASRDRAHQIVDALWALETTSTSTDHELTTEDDMKAYIMHDGVKPEPNWFVIRYDMSSKTKVTAAVAENLKETKNYIDGSGMFDQTTLSTIPTAS
jgi:hypothetical protein